MGTRKKDIIVGLAIVMLSSVSALALAAPPVQPSREVLPVPPVAFDGTIGTTSLDSEPGTPSPLKAPANAPNIVLVLTDDVGFAAASTFGGPVPTPNLDRLARSGLVYNRFHTTAMCSPTRAALLTGRNHHAVGNGIITDIGGNYPGYNDRIPHSAATVADVLRLNGYSTAMFGKHHNVPKADMSPAGPFDQWPTGLGFEYFFGFLGGDTNQWQPRLYRGTTLVDDNPPRGETLDHLLIDDAIAWVHTQKAAVPDKPFLLYLAPGSAHAPHQAPPEWIAKFQGQFDSGWDLLREQTLRRQKALGIAPQSAKLTPRPASIPAWSTLSAEARAVDARMMETFAGMLAYQDAQFGRLLDELERMGLRDNTLIIFIEGDNGGSAEGGVEGSMNELGTLANGVIETTASKQAVMAGMGGPDTYQLYPVGWAWATNTPFQWAKQIGSHLGGIRNGMVISWPERIPQRGMRPQFGHVVDIMPTIFEATGLPAPKIVEGAEQRPINGVSLAYSFAGADVPEKARTQYFEMAGNRAIYKDGWLANTTPRRLPWETTGPAGSPQDYAWELYDLKRDFSQSTNLATRDRARLEALKADWMEEAKRNNVLPLDDRLTGRSKASSVSAKPRTSFVYWGKGISVPQSAAPQFGQRSFRITAEIVVPENGLNGALIASGSKFGGWSFLFEDGHPVVVHAFSRQPGEEFRIAASEAIPAGPVSIIYDFLSAGAGRGGELQISVNGKTIVRGAIPRSAIITAGTGETFDIGGDSGAPVTIYAVDDRFNGEVRKIDVRMK